MGKNLYSAYRVLFAKNSATVAILSPTRAALHRIHSIKALKFFDNRIKHLKKRTDKKNGFYSLWKFESTEEKSLFLEALARRRYRTTNTKQTPSRKRNRFEDRTATPEQKRVPVWRRFKKYREVCRFNKAKRISRIKQQREALKRRALILATEQKARDLARFAAISDLI